MNIRYKGKTYRGLSVYVEKRTHNNPFNEIRDALLSAPNSWSKWARFTNVGWFSIMVRIR